MNMQSGNRPSGHDLGLIAGQRRENSLIAARRPAAVRVGLAGRELHPGRPETDVQHCAV